jgi:ribosomal protein L6P/L9E
MKIKELNKKESLSLSLIYLAKIKFLVVEKNGLRNYVLFPEFTDIISEKNKYTFRLHAENKISAVKFYQFNKSLDYFVKDSQTISKKKLILKGLGFRMNFSAETRKLELKVGFSHFIYMNVPLNLGIKIRKNMLDIEGSDKNLLGNFVGKIRAVKIPDCYKGKGFWYKYQKESLKAIKKK